MGALFDSLWGQSGLLPNCNDLSCMCFAGAEAELQLRMKTYVFDDMHCLGQWLDAGNVRNADIAAIWLVDYSTPGTLIAAASSHLLHSEQLSSPMNGNVAAFKSPDSIHKFTETFPGEQTDWYSWRKH